MLRLSTSIWAKVRFFSISLTLSLCNVNRHWRERESHARTWINAFINIPVIYIACSYLWRIFCYIICLCISRFSAFVYQEKKNRIKCDYRCRVLAVLLSVANPSINSGKKTHLCGYGRPFADDVTFKLYTCLIMDKGAQNTVGGYMKEKNN